MNKISTKHFIFFLLGVTVISLKTYTSIFITLGDRDTWIISIFSSLVFIIYLIYIISTCVRTKTFDIKEIFSKSYPKIISKILLFVFSLNLFINALESASVETNALRSTLFSDTPVWYILIFFLLPSFFILNKDIRTVLIFVLISVFLLILNCCFFFIFPQGYSEHNNLMPTLANGFSFDFFKTFLYILGGYSTFLISIPYLKYIDNSKKLRKHSIFAALIAIVIIVISFIMIIATFGPLRAKNIFYPEFVMAQRIKIAGFLEFGEFFFIMQTVVGFFVKYALSTYAILIIYNEEIKNKKLFIGIYSFLIYVLSNYLGRNNYYLHQNLLHIQKVNLICFILIPLVTFSIYNIKFKAPKTDKVNKN